MTSPLFLTIILICSIMIIAPPPPGPSYLPPRDEREISGVEFEDENFGICTQKFYRVRVRVDQLFQNRVLIHAWEGSGMDFGDFIDARARGQPLTEAEILEILAVEPGAFAECAYFGRWMFTPKHLRLRP